MNTGDCAAAAHLVERWSLTCFVLVAVLDGVTVEHLRLFLCVAEEGSFSAGGRRLGKVQSAVSYGISQLEDTLGVELFDRGGRQAQLTDAGRALIDDARCVLERMGRFGARAAALADGTETSVCVVFDTIFPAVVFANACRGFHREFPNVRLRVHSEVLGEVVRLILDGTCELGIGGPVSGGVNELERQFLANVALVPVVSQSHPLARVRGRISTEQVRDVLQIVIAERTQGDDSARHTVLSRRTWRVADAVTKLALIRGGLGWGHLPIAVVADELRSGGLVRLELAEWGTRPVLVPMFAITRVDASLGRAAMWLRRHLAAVCSGSPV